MTTLPQEALQRILDVVLISRIPCIAEEQRQEDQRMRNRRQRVSLLLDVGSVDCVSDLLESYWMQGKGNATLRLDIFGYRRDPRLGIHSSPVSFLPVSTARGQPIERPLPSHHCGLRPLFRQAGTPGAMDH